MPAPTLIPSRILCDWKIRHQTHVLCGRTTFVPNQIRYQTYTVPTCGAQHTQGGAGCSTHCAVQHSTRGAVLRSMVQCRTAHTVQCTGQDTQWGAEHNTHSVVQSTAHRVWSSTQSSAAQHPGCSAVYSIYSAVEGTTRTVQCSTVQCSAAQHTPCGAVHSTHSAQHRTQYAVQGTARTMHCSMHSAAQHSTVQCTTHTMRCGVQHSQCKARCSTHSAGQPENCSAGGGGGVDMDARRRKGGGVGEMGFRVGPFVLCKNGCWRQRHRNTNLARKSFFHQ